MIIKKIFFFRKITFRQTLENSLINLFIKSSQVFDDSDNESNHSDSEEELFNAEDDKMILLGLCTLLDSRYLESRFQNNVAKSQEWWHLIVPKYDDIRFKKIMRMDSQSFQNLITNIEIHSIFQSTGNKQQAPVELQLAIFLRRMGSKNEIFSICSH